MADKLDFLKNELTNTDNKFKQEYFKISEKYIIRYMEYILNNEEEDPPKKTKEEDGIEKVN